MPTSGPDGVPRQPRAPLLENGEEFFARVFDGDRRRATRDPDRDLHPVRGQGRPRAAPPPRRSRAARRAAWKSPSTAMARRSFSPEFLAGSPTPACVCGCSTRTRAVRHAPARVPAHAPQAAGRRRRTRVRRRHQLLRRPSARLRPDGQAGLRGGTARARWSPTSMASCSAALASTRHRRILASGARAAATDSACGRRRR